MRILMLGNSLTAANGLPQKLAGALHADVTAHVRGGARLSEQLNPETELGAKTLDALTNRRWDFVVIQGGGTEALRSPERFRGNAERLCALARGAGAQPVLFVTWGYLDQPDPAKAYDAIRAAYALVGERTGALLADVGALFRDGGEKLLAKDGRHPTEEGTALACSCIAGTIAAAGRHPSLVAPDDARVRVLRLLQILRERYGFETHRTTLPRDIDALRDAGIEVMSERGQARSFYLSDRLFSTPELRLLIDAVQSGKFITEKKSRILVEKLMSLTGKPGSALLRRAVHATGKSKSDNEKGYYIVDAVNEAILRDKRVSLVYFDYDGEKRRVARNGGKPYTVSPYDLIWDGDYYYLIGWCDDRGEIRVYRVDRIERQPDILEQKRVPPPKGYRIESYTSEVIRMYGGREPEDVTIECDDALMKHVIDRFGMDVDTHRTSPGRFAANVRVSAGPTFLRWVFGWGGGMRITAPESLRREYREWLERELALYR